MRSRLRIIFFLSIYASYASAQLIPNGNFETLSGSLTGEGQINVASGWGIPNQNLATPDLYNSAFVGPAIGPCDNVNVPVNAGGFATAHSGTGYAGISTDFIGGNYEYITRALGLPLNPGDIYILDMWVLRADSSRYANNAIGAFFSSAPPIVPNTGILSLPPHFESNQLITDANNWTHLNFTPYQATGGEQWITIGIFKSNGGPGLIQQDLGQKNSGCASFDDKSYYYIDDINLVPDVPLFILPEDTVYICPYNYTKIIDAITNIPVIWTNQNGDTIDFDAQLQVPGDTMFAYFIPGAEFTYYLHGNGMTDSVRVIVIYEPQFNLGPDTTLCEGVPDSLSAFASDAIFYTWSNGDSMSYTFATDTGMYYVTVDNIGCAITDSIYLYDLLPNPAINIGEDSIFCFYNYDTLRLDASTSDAIGYLWRPNGETTPGISVKTEDYYEVTVTRENGCARKAGFEVLEICPATFFIPNAFTPDGDGINDQFKISVENFDGYTLRIFNRSGTLLFETDNNSDSWDGTYRGSNCPIGVYTYKININGFTADGEKDRKKLLGTFVLYR